MLIYIKCKKNLVKFIFGSFSLLELLKPGVPSITHKTNFCIA
jgi:hypothetical protein